MEKVLGAPSHYCCEQQQLLQLQEGIGQFFGEGFQHQLGGGLLNDEGACGFEQADGIWGLGTRKFEAWGFGEADGIWGPESWGFGKADEFWGPGLRSRFADEDAPASRPFLIIPGNNLPALCAESNLSCIK